MYDSLSERALEDRRENSLLLKKIMESNPNKIDFFNEKDFAVLEDFANQKMDWQNHVKNEAYEFLKTTYEKVNFWGKLINEKFSNFNLKIIRKPTNRAGNFSEYLWAKIYPSKKAPQNLAFTIEINANGFLILKIDTINLPSNSELRQKYLEYRKDFDSSFIVFKIPKHEVFEGNWNKLVNTSIMFIEQRLEEYYNLADILNPKDKQIERNEEIEEVGFERKYWLMVYSAKDWPNKFSKPQTYWLHNKYANNEYRLLKENFEQAEKGDVVIGMHLNPDIKNRSFFTITKSIHESSSDEKERIDFKLLMNAEGAFTKDDLLNYPLVELSEAAQHQFKNGLYKLSNQELFYIYSKMGVTESDLVDSINDDTYIPVIQNDTIQDGIIDQLDFENDIETLAALVAYKKVNPPLAIGLFGNWGTGKSFFMHNLSKKLDKYSNISKIDFCEHIVKVNFNSWHYSDTNLWASIANNIFASLKNYIDNFNSTSETVGDSAKLFQELNSTKIKIRDKEFEKERVESEIEKNKEELNRLIEEKKEKVKSLNVSSADIIKAVLENEQVKNSVNKLQSQTVAPVIDNFETLQQQLSLLQNVSYRSYQAFRNISKYNLKQKIYFVLIPVVFIISPWVIPAVFSNYIGQASIFMNLTICKLLFLIGGFSVFFTPINKVLAIHESLHNKMQDLINKELEKKSIKEQEKEKVLDAFRSQEAIINSQLQNLFIAKSKIEVEIEEIKSGKKLADWVIEKANSQDYKKHLGVISMIRQDFERLDTLMDDQKQALKSSGQALTDLFKIDRIVLFIDDLDRCSEDKVMEVLQAVHLLLSFKLFVVVVGVDPRWLENVIQNRYRIEMGYEKKVEKDNDIPLKAKDYLEKIFQIPFKLKTMSFETSKRMITSLTNSNSISTNKSDSSIVETIQSITGSTIPVKENKQLSLGGTTVNSIANVKENETIYKRKEIQATELEFNEQERDFMYSISSFLTRSPRNIKRYINIYRLIKAHPDYAEMNNARGNYITLALLALEIGGKLDNQIWYDNIRKVTKNEVTFSGVEGFPEFSESESSNKMNELFKETNVLPYKRIVEFIRRFSYNN